MKYVVIKTSHFRGDWVREVVKEFKLKRDAKEYVLLVERGYGMSTYIIEKIIINNNN